jgi:hypothetical protein
MAAALARRQALDLIIVVSSVLLQLDMWRRSDGRMQRRHFRRKYRSALVLIAVRYSLTKETGSALEPVSNLRGHFDLTLEVIDVTTSDAIAN